MVTLEMTTSTLPASSAGSSSLNGITLVTSLTSIELAMSRAMSISNPVTFPDASTWVMVGMLPEVPSINWPRC